MEKPSRLARLSIIFLLFGVNGALAVEHPGVLAQAADCSSCHKKQISGKSVHSVMASSCTVCHVAMTRGDMTTLNLLMPKEKICSACHQESAELQKHSTAIKGQCVDCHDAHSSDYRLLLLTANGTPPPPLRRK